MDESAVGFAATRFLSIWVIVLIASSVVFSQTPAPGDLVINEVHADPASGLEGDANGDEIRDALDDEFVELVNVSGVDLDLSGLTLERDGTVTHVFPAGMFVPDDCAVVVFGGGSPNGVFGGAMVDTASSGGLSLVNSGAVVTLKNGGTEISTFVYGGAGCEGDENQSVTLDPDLTGTCALHSQIPGSGGALFSPGTRVNAGFFGECGILVFTDGFESGDVTNWSATAP
jgi:hypothetical protein